VSDDLGIEPEVSIGLAQGLKDPNVLVVGPLKNTSNLPDSPLP